MAQFSKRKSHAEHVEARVRQLRENGRHDLIKPMEAHRIDHHRVDDGWRHRKSKDVWRGAKGKQKHYRLPNS